MISDELYDAFRSDIVDEAKPHLWSDSEVWRYMQDSYVMFVRLTGGVPDATSDITQVDVVAGAGDAVVSRLILKFREATLNSTGRPLKIINHTNVPMISGGDYGRYVTPTQDKTPGIVSYMVIGKQRGLVSWRQVPLVDDSVTLLIDRLPLNPITGEGQEFTDVDPEHHEAFLMWMKHRAYGKQDADTFDKGRSDSYKAAFTDYCLMAKAEWERMKTKVRVVSYGGI